MIVMTMRGISSIRKTEMITAAIAETRCKSRIFGFWRILKISVVSQRNCILLVVYLPFLLIAIISFALRQTRMTQGTK